MNLTKMLLPSLAALLALCTAETSKAALTWNFATGPSSVAPSVSSKSYSDTTLTASILANGYTTANSPSSSSVGSTWATGTTTAANLYEKWSGSLNDSETGLGLAQPAGSSDHEIQAKSFIQLDFSSLSKSTYNSLDLLISSVQGGEGYYVWGSASAGTPGILLGSGLGGNTDNFLVSASDWTAYNYFSISASAGDVLLMNGLTLNQIPRSSVPEPSTVVAGALLLLPFGVSTLRILRKARKT